MTPKVVLGVHEGIQNLAKQDAKAEAIMHVDDVSPGHGLGSFFFTKNQMYVLGIVQTLLSKKLI